MKTLITSLKQKRLIKKGVTLSKGIHNISDDLILEIPCALEGKLNTSLKVGRFTYINSKTVGNAIIGRFCSIAAGVNIGTHGDHPTTWLSTHPFQYISNFYKWSESDYKTQPFKEIRQTNIGNDVWIGANAFIKNGVVISNGAIIGAGAVVTKDVPPYAIVAGVPAKIIRYRFEPHIIEELLKLKWWDLNLSDLDGIDFSNIHHAVTQIQSRNLKSPPSEILMADDFK